MYVAMYNVVTGGGIIMERWRHKINFRFENISTWKSEDQVSWENKGCHFCYWATGLHTLNILKAGKNKCQRLAMCLCPVFEGTLIVKYTERFVSSLLGTLIWDYFYFLI